MGCDILPSYVAGFFDGEGCISIVETKFKKRMDGLRDLLPFATIKKPQIEIALEYLETQRGGRRLPDSARVYRMVLKHQLYKEKHRHVPIGS